MSWCCSYRTLPHVVLGTEFESHAVLDALFTPEPFLLPHLYSVILFGVSLISHTYSIEMWSQDHIQCKHSWSFLLYAVMLITSSYTAFFFLILNLCDFFHALFTLSLYLHPQEICEHSTHRHTEKLFIGFRYWSKMQIHASRIVFNRSTKTSHVHLHCWRSQAPMLVICRLCGL